MAFLFKPNLRHMKKRIILILLAAFLTAPSFAQVEFNPAMLGEMKIRQIGPATMSGRVSAIDALERDANLVYVGAANGGLWKSTNGGTTFQPVFDKHTQSIGTITIDQQRPDTVWVGTGEVWVRNSVSVGDGVYRTYDGGKTWQHLGLQNSERISKIIIHPNDPNTVFVAVLGALWSDSPDRGIYKTTDGGKNWEKVLFVDNRTGASDLTIDPTNPDHLIAGMYSFRRQAWDYFSGGKGSGMFESKDGGKTWARMTQDLPKGLMGRISISRSGGDSNILYALIESDSTALFKSTNGGASWKEVNRSPVVKERPFYFNLIVADPVDTAKVWKPGLNLYMSKDGGKSFIVPYPTNQAGGGIHVDHHALWINPKDNRHMYLGTDGGVYISRDGAQTWGFVRTLPLSQFYHVSADNERPYNVYGGLQDNGSWMGPSRGVGGIRIGDWQNLGGGDGFYVFPDPKDPGIVYWQSQGGNINRFYTKTCESKAIKPSPASKDEKLRFNWNTPVHFGKASGAMYVGAQFLYRSNDRGDSWERISPDLTTNNPEKQKQAQSGGLTKENTSAENHTTLYAINESPLDGNVVWVGTDDGNLQITRDGGKSWNNVARNVSGLPANTWVSYVAASHHAQGRAYATFDGHRSGDMKPYVFKTEDFGATWVSLVDTTLTGYAHVIVEDPVNPTLLFLGTEFGLFISIDQGKNWIRFPGNIPPVAIMDMMIHPIENDLIMATHGRGIFILDDITPLRGLNSQVLDMEVAILPSRPYRIGAFGGQQIFPGDDEYVGPNPVEEATISYYLKKRHIFGDMKVLILDENDNILADIPAGKSKGINRVAWSPRRKAPKVPTSGNTFSFNALFGPSYPPGEYKVRIIKGDEIIDGSIILEYDPASPHSKEDRDLQQKTVMQAYNMLEDLAYMDAQVVDIAKQAKDLGPKAKGRLNRSLKTLADRMDAYHKSFVETQGGMFTDEVQLREQISEIFGGVSRFQGRPGDNQIQRLNSLNQELTRLRTEIDNIFAKDLAAINSDLEKEGLSLITILSREKFFE